MKRLMRVALATLAFLFLASTASAATDSAISSTSIPAEEEKLEIPEAAAFILFGTGLAGLIGYRRMRRMS